MSEFEPSPEGRELPLDNWIRPLRCGKSEQIPTRIALMALDLPLQEILQRPNGLSPYPQQGVPEILEPATSLGGDNGVQVIHYPDTGLTYLTRVPFFMANHLVAATEVLENKASIRRVSGFEGEWISLPDAWIYILVHALDREMHEENIERETAAISEFLLSYDPINRPRELLAQVVNRGFELGERGNWRQAVCLVREMLGVYSSASLFSFWLSENARYFGIGLGEAIFPRKTRERQEDITAEVMNYLYYAVVTTALASYLRPNYPDAPQLSTKNTVLDTSKSPGLSGQENAPVLGSLEGLRENVYRLLKRYCERGTEAQARFKAGELTRVKAYIREQLGVVWPRVLPWEQK